MRAALAALRTPIGAGLAELGCIMVRITLSTLIRKTEARNVLYNKGSRNFNSFEFLPSFKMVLKDQVIYASNVKVI